MGKVKIISSWIFGGKQMQGKIAEFDIEWLKSIKIQYEEDKGQKDVSELQSASSKTDKRV